MRNFCEAIRSGVVKDKQKGGKVPTNITVRGIPAREGCHL